MNQTNYRRQSRRLQSWDYASNGYYFVTICVKDHENILGDIIDGNIELSDIGKIVKEEWLKTGLIRKNVYLDEWVIMPNHLHGIIKMEKPTSQRDVATINETTNKNNKTLISQSIGAIICQFKSMVTKRARQLGDNDFKWQERYYDHIIRNEKGLDEIREYIVNNPSKWEIGDHE